MTSETSNGWRICTIDEIKAESNSALAIGPFGSRMKADCYVESGVPVIRGNNISNTKVLRGDFVYVSEEKANELASSNVFDGDLVFPHRGLIGEVGIVIGRPDAHYILSTSLMKLTPNRELADPLFLFYFFRSSAGRHELLKNASQVGTPGIATPLASLRSVRVTLPPLFEQKAIADVLGTLDDKIELNRRMNETLETIAQAIFKSWFVDFDPVRAKAAGQTPPGLDPEIAALFPDSFEQSELGAIPRGWRVNAIRELASNIQYGLTQSAATEPVGPRFLRITDIQGGHVDWARVPYCKVSPRDHERYGIKRGDVLVARTGASTGENIYLCTAPDAVFGSYLVRFQFEDPAVARLVGAFMRTSEYFDFVAGSIGGSAQPNASAQVLAGAPIVSPRPEIARRFAQLLAPLDKRIAANNDESLSLDTLRDVLLPKLLSGEIRVDRIVDCVR